MRLKRIHTLVTILVVLFFTLSACSSQAQPAAVEGLAQTLAMRTLIATHGIALVISPTPSPGPSTAAAILPGAATATPQPAQPARPTLKPTRTSQLTKNDLLAGSNDCNNAAEFMEDVTVPDDTKLNPGELFTKVWLVRNVGTCTWTEEYALVFTWGEQMSGMSPRRIGQVVRPGETIELGIDLIAPKMAESYQGNWMLRDTQGNRFGTGYAGRDPFWVAVIIGSTGFGGMVQGCLGGG